MLTPSFVTRHARSMSRILAVLVACSRRRSARVRIEELRVDPTATSHGSGTAGTIPTMR